MTIPRPGRPVRGSKTGRPIMAVLDLLGRRWALRALWELREGPQTFRGLQERCGAISPSVLNQRLAELRDAGLIENPEDRGYQLTQLGTSLAQALIPLSHWAEVWASQTGPEADPPR